MAFQKISKSQIVANYVGVEIHTSLGDIRDIVGDEALSASKSFGVDSFLN